MNKKKLMRTFISKLEKEKLLTLFIKNIFDYDEFYDYNYIFRMQENDTSIIMDIYDNVSNNRFNRYIFSFAKGSENIIIKEENKIFIYFIYVFNVEDSDDKLYKLAYLFKTDSNKMIEYAKSFLDDRIVKILKDSLK